MQSMATPSCPRNRRRCIQLHPAELRGRDRHAQAIHAATPQEISADTPSTLPSSADSRCHRQVPRALGFDVDQVTIIQPVITSPSPTRTDDISAVPTPQAATSMPGAGPRAEGNGNGSRQERQSTGVGVTRPGTLLLIAATASISSAPVIPGPGRRQPLRAGDPARRRPLRRAGRHPLCGRPDGDGKQGQPAAQRHEYRGKSGVSGKRPRCGDCLPEGQEPTGATLIDLGCMQINHHYHAEHFKSVEEMLDPRRNVDYAARFLTRLKSRHDTGRWRWRAITRGRTTIRRRSAMSAASSPTWWRPASANGRATPAASANPPVVISRPPHLRLEAASPVLLRPCRRHPARSTENLAPICNPQENSYKK